MSEKKSERLSKEEREARRLEGIARATQARGSILAERVKTILASDRVDPELKRKLKYCQDEINKGRRDSILTRRDELIKETQRRFNINP